MVLEEPPDPATSRTPEDLIAQLRLLKAWAGDPSYATIASRVNDAWRAVGRPAGEWITAKNTVADCFKDRPHSNDELMLAIVGVLSQDPAYLSRWRRVLRIIRGEAEAATFVTALDRLPEGLPAFAGRSTELDQLRRLAGGGCVAAISAIDGMPGVGKTALAIHAGHQLLRQGSFDQVLFVDLRGFHPDPGQPPADPAAVLAAFLRLLGVPGDRIQSLDLDGRTAVYRRLLRQRRALVVLDNAASEGHVGGLIPDGPGCVTLITSRRTLARLAGVRHLPLGCFTPAEALDMLRIAAGRRRFEADPEAAALIAELLGYLPLALGVTASRISSQPWPLVEHLEGLLTRHEVARPDGSRTEVVRLPPDRVQRARALRVEDRVRLALSLSYDDLPPAPRRLFRLLALHPGPDLDVPAAAALAGTDGDTARRHLDTVLAGNLIQQGQPRRYVLHDVVRAFAFDRVHDEERASDRRAAVTRLLDHYRYAASTAADLLTPSDKDRRPAIAPPGTPVVAIDDRAGAAGWLETELPNLLACAAHSADGGWPQHAVDLASILRGYLDNHALYAEGGAVHTHALRAARQEGDLVGQADALRALGVVDGRQGRYQRAAEHHQQALTIYRRLGDSAGAGLALAGLGVVYDRWGRYEQAAEHYQQAMALQRVSGDRAGEGIAMINLGNVYQRWGRYEQAVAYLQGGLVLHRDSGDLRGEGAALTYLGHLYQRWGQLDQAQEHYEQALALRRATADRHGEGYALTYLGTVHGLRGRYDQARDHLQRGLALHRAIGARSDEGRALAYLGLLHGLLGDHRQALAQLEQALALARDIGDRDLEIESLNGLGEVTRGHGQFAEALDHHRAALGVDTGDRHQQAQAHLGLGQTWHALGNLDRARDHARRALALYSELGVPAADHARRYLASLGDGDAS